MFEMNLIYQEEEDEYRRFDLALFHSMAYIAVCYYCFKMIPRKGGLDNHIMQRGMITRTKRGLMSFYLDDLLA